MRFSPYPATVCPSTEAAAYGTSGGRCLSGEPSRRSVLADTPVSFVHPAQVEVVVERSQRLVPVFLRRQYYPPSSCSPAHRPL